MPHTPNNHRIVIVGGGAGGLELAANLGRRFGPDLVVLVDSTPYHIWKPSLHEVAAGTLDIHREGLSYSMLAKDCGFTFVLGTMEGVDRDLKTVFLKPVIDEQGEELFSARTIPYDSLVIAIGSKANFFGTPGAAQHAIALDATKQAERFRLKFLRAVLTADAHKAEHPDHVLNLVIVGGGATGVELAAELTEAGRDLAHYGLTRLIPARDIRITILEGAPRILALLPEKLSKSAHALLHARNVNICTGIRVAEVKADKVVDSLGREYAADLCVWAAGIEAPAVLTTLAGLATNKQNQLVVDSQLRTEDPNIFAMGDCAAAPWVDGKTMPARAQVAHQQAQYLARTMHCRVYGKQPPSAAFTFHDKGSLVSVGQGAGVGSLMGVLIGRSMFVEGLVARWMYMSLHLMHHQAVLGTGATVLMALGRLLLRRSSPRVKLH